MDFAQEKNWAASRLEVAEPKAEKDSVRNFVKKQDKLTREAQFTEVFDKGEAYSGKGLLRAFVLKRQGGGVRAGIIAGKKVGIAVKRNRAKRLLREGLKKLQGRIKEGRDIVLIASSRAAEASLLQVVAALEEALKQSLQNT